MTPTRYQWAIPCILENFRYFLYLYFLYSWKQFSLEYMSPYLFPRPIRSRVVEKINSYYDYIRKYSPARLDDFEFIRYNYNSNTLNFLEYHFLDFHPNACQREVL